MNNIFESKLNALRESGNFRSIRNLSAEKENLIDLSSNDYLGLASNHELIDEFMSTCRNFTMSSSASRLLSSHQNDFFTLENTLSSLYGRDALIFNSGYHANTGIIPTIADKDTLIIADRLVHASIIDGIVLSRAPFLRFHHNDLEHLEEILHNNYLKYNRILIVTESIFSMDGDICDLKRLVGIKNSYPNILLYVDEAHAFGVFGDKGLGCAEESGLIDDIDIIVGTFGKACASSGAFVITSGIIKDYLINKCRSFIFSTAIPPFSCAWTDFILHKITDMSAERTHLKAISQQLQSLLNPLNNMVKSASQIVPYIIGNSEATLAFSEKIRAMGYLALPIRTPTVPTGTERIRFSLNASITQSQMNQIINDLKRIINEA